MVSVYITGVGMTKIDKHWDTTVSELASEALRIALNEAGMESVDAVFVGNMLSGIVNSQENLASLVVSYAGLYGTPAFKVEAACASGAAAIASAFISLKSGMFKDVAVVGVEKMSDETSVEGITRALATAADSEYELYHGVSFTALNALIMQRYSYEFNVKPEDYGLWSIQMHKNATMNPYAQLRFEITMEKYLSSQWISKPIRFMDCSPVGDGAAALILSSKKPKDSPIEIAGVGMATDKFQSFLREDLLTLAAAKIAAKRAYNMANIRPEDIDMVEVHDAFTIMGVLSLEALGLAERGEGIELLKNGDIKPDGTIPTNLAGGLKARGHPVGATGVYQVAELSLQLRGTPVGVKLDNPNIGVALNLGGLASNCYVTVLKGE